jgi:hypothetical protein
MSAHFGHEEMVLRAAAILLILIAGRLEATELSMGVVASPTPMAALANCNWRLQTTRPSSFNARSLNDKISVTLNLMARGNNGDVRSFFQAQGERVVIAGGPVGYTVSDRPARRLNKSAGSNSMGDQNAGLFFYQADDGTSRVMKLLRVDPVALEDTSGVRHPVPSAIQEIAQAYWGERYGAPNLYRFGFAFFEGQTYVYLDMEELFPGQQFMTSKDLMKEQNLEKTPETRGQMHRDFVQICANYSGGDALVRKIARLVIAPIFDGIAPSDPDFVLGVTPGQPVADVRWIDTGHWKWYGADRDKLFDKYEDIVRKFLPAGHLPGEPDRIPLEAHYSKVFLTEFLRVLKHDPRFTEAEKYLLIEYLFKERQNFIKSGVTKIQVLYESGVIASPDGAGQSAVQAVLALYESLT